MAKALKWIGLILAVAAIGAQFKRPPQTNPVAEPSRSLEAMTQMTPQVSAILDRACRDCHTNRTEWPWYSNVAPVSWFVIDHVDHGRSHCVAECKTCD